MLLDVGSSINYKDCGECTPLFHAIYSHQTEVADILIKGIYLRFREKGYLFSGIWGRRVIYFKRFGEKAWF